MHCVEQFPQDLFFCQFDAQIQGKKFHVPVQLAVIVGIEVNDVDSTASVVLNDLVRSVICTATNDSGLSSSLVVLDGNGILTYVLEPYVLQSAVAVTVNTFGLVLANDSVLEGGSSAKDEDGVGFTWCSLDIIRERMNDVESSTYLLRSDQSMLHFRGLT